MDEMMWHRLFIRINILLQVREWITPGSELVIKLKLKVSFAQISIVAGQNVLCWVAKALKEVAVFLEKRSLDYKFQSSFVNVFPIWHSYSVFQSQDSSITG